MKTQDKSHLNSTSSTSPSFHQVGNNSFYIKSTCISVDNRTLIIGNKYILDQHPSSFGVKISEVILLDCGYYDCDIILIVRDVMSQEVFALECTEKEYCPWVLMDFKYYNDLLDEIAIEQYCGCKDASKLKDHRSDPTCSNLNSEGNSSTFAQQHVFEWLEKRYPISNLLSYHSSRLIGAEHSLVKSGEQRMNVAKV